MFEQILKSLKNKYKDLGLSDNILKVIATKLAKTVKEETEIETAIESMQEDLQIYQSFADQNRTLLKELQTLKNQPKAGEEPVGTGGKPKTEPNEEGVPVWAKQLIDNQKAISENLTALQQERAQISNGEKLINKLKELGVNEKFYTGIIEGRSFQNDEEINAFANSVKEKEDVFMQEINNKKLSDDTPPVFGKTDGNSGVSADVQDFIKTKLKTNEAN